MRPFSKNRWFAVLALLACPILANAALDENTTVFIKHVAPRISAQKLPKQLVCSKVKKAVNFLVALDNAMAAHHITISKDGTAWMEEAFPAFGFVTTLPSNPGDQVFARRVLELVRRNNLTAAKLANDISAFTSPTYKAESFYRNINHYIDSGTRPIGLNPNGSDPPYEKWLAGIPAKISAAQKTLGPYFAYNAVRYYVYGNAFDDGLAVDATAQVLCSTLKDKTLLGAISAVGANVRTRQPHG